MNPAFVGTWSFPVTRPFAQELLFTLYADGRAVQFFRQAETLNCRVASTMRLHLEGEGKYRVRTEPSTLGYVVTITREKEFLVVQNGDHRVLCSPVAHDQLPDWHAEAAARAVWR